MRSFRWPELLLLVGLLYAGWFAGFSSRTRTPTIRECVFPIGTATTTCTGVAALGLPLDVIGAKPRSDPFTPASFTAMILVIAALLLLSTVSFTAVSFTAVSLL
jgi:hypothetical protein